MKSRAFRLPLLASLPLFAALVAGCVKQSGPPRPQPPPAYAPYPPAPGPYPPPPGPHQPPPPGHPPPGYTYPPAPQQPGPQAPPPPPSAPSIPPGSVDSTGTMTPAFIRQQPARVVAELIAALPESSRAKVVNMPTIVIDDAKEINAYAGCNQGGASFVAITTPLLVFHARAAEARAFDEIFRTSHYDNVVRTIAAEIREGRNIQGPPPGTLPTPQALDPRKLARQKHLLEEQLAFVFGHELAHHYRGHTGCVARPSSGVGPEDIARVLSNQVPFLNQPNEIDSDVQGVYNLLNAGKNRREGVWTEAGAMMVLDLFSRLSSLGIDTVLLGFLLTHPPPQLRTPIVQSAASQWRSSGGQGNQFPFPFPMPF